MCMLVKLNCSNSSYRKCVQLTLLQMSAAYATGFWKVFGFGNRPIILQRICNIFRYVFHLNCLLCCLLIHVLCIVACMFGLCSLRLISYRSNSERRFCAVCTKQSLKLHQLLTCLKIADFFNTTKNSMWIMKDKTIFLICNLTLTFCHFYSSSCESQNCKAVCQAAEVQLKAEFLYEAKFLMKMFKHQYSYRIFQSSISKLFKNYSNIFCPSLQILLLKRGENMTYTVNEP